MNTQPEAMRLAESISRMDTFTEHQRGELLKAAAELRRLHALNAELVKALIRLVRSFPTDSDLYEAQWEGHEIEEAMRAHAAAVYAIAKTEAA